MTKDAIRKGSLMLLGFDIGLSKNIKARPNNHFQITLYTREN